MFTEITGAIVRRSRVIMLGLALSVGVSVTTTDFGSTMERYLERGRSLFFEKKASGDVVVVAIDQPSLDRLNGWPFKRSMHGEVVRKLTALGAGKVVFDVAFDSKSQDPAEDQKLAGAMKDNPGKVGIIAVDDMVNGKMTAIPPNEDLRPHAEVLNGYIGYDIGTQVYEFPYTGVIEGEKHKSLSAFIEDAASENDTFQPDWSVDINSIPTISYADVVKGKLKKEQVQGKTFVIGATATGMGDQWITIWDKWKPGVYFHVLAAETLKAGVPKNLGGYPPLLVIGLIIIMASYIRDKLAATLSIFCGGLLVMIAAWLFQENFKIAMDVVPAEGAALVAIAFAIISSIAAKIMTTLTTNEGTSLPNLTAMKIDNPEGVTVAVRLRNYLETSSALGKDKQTELLRRARDRIKVAAGEDQVYQVDEHSFSWRTKLEGVELLDAVEGLVALFAGGIPVGGKTIDAPISVGICDTEIEIQSSVNQALLASDSAARQGLPWTKHQEEAADAEWRVSMMSQLEEGLDNGDVWVAYQPKYDLHEGKVVGAEALVRWTHPERGPIRPDHFIPALEEAGRIDKLTLHVLETAIRDFAPLNGINVAVNLSTIMLGKGKIVGAVKTYLAKYGMNPNCLTLEVTESAAMNNGNEVNELVELKELGVKISIDDYGTGQSTLTYLKKLPATELKIDQSFVRVVLNSKSDQLMISSTVSLAHELGMKVVAEGVETNEVLEALRDLDCDIIQGYYIGKPAAFNEFVMHIAKDIISNAA